MPLLNEVVAGILVSAFTLVAKRGYDSLTTRRRLGYLYSATARQQPITIVLPRVPVERFSVLDPNDEIGDVIHHSPRNVLFMPMAEGDSIARLALTLQSIRPRAKILFVDASRAAEGEALLISVGGPSVNGMSASLIQRYLPDFRIDYPQATRAEFAATTFRARFSKGGDVTEDVGFILKTPTRSHGAASIVLWGILAFGTGIATQALLDLKGLDRHAAAAFRDPDGRFLVCRAKVRDFMIEDINLVHSWPVRQP